MAKKTGCGTVAIGCVCVPIFGVVAVVCIVAMTARGTANPTFTNTEAPIPTAPESNQTISTIEGIEMPSIPGIAAADVHINFEKEGFTTKKRLGGVQSEWECTLKDGLNEYNVTAYGKGPETIWTVKATAVSAAPTPPFDEIQRFFAKVATLTYDGANQERAQLWAAANWQKHQAKTRIGKAEFEFVQGNRLVMLTIRGVK